jgi:molybdopterin biosynthesis enzyme MoaB
VTEAPASARSATVLVVSTRASAGVYADETGPVIRAWLAERGFAVGDPVVVADAGVAEALAAALAGAPDLLLTTGGTGLSRRPHPRGDRRAARPGDPRAHGGAAPPRPRRDPDGPAHPRGGRVAGRTVVMNLPGSRGGVRDGLAVLDPILDHLLAQLSGRGDHR